MVFQMYTYDYTITELVIGLSEDLMIGRGSPISSGPGVRLDHVQFHPAISLAEFEQQRVLRTQSQEGEVGLSIIKDFLTGFSIIC